MKKLFAIIALLMSITACTGTPENITPVQNFELNKYLGKWYEIARLDHSFERGLENITAEYAMREDGGVSVLNKGYDITEKSWRDAQGKAYFVESTDQGYLKVSFFGPFYGSYIIFELDKDYQYAFVSGPNTDYLWLLSRTPTVDPSLIEHFKTLAKEKGFKTEELIFVNQQKNSLE